MSRWLTLVAFAWIATSSAPAVAAPSWVVPADAPQTVAPEGGSGVHWHLSDRQVRHTPSQVQIYQRLVLTLQDDDAVRDWESLWFSESQQIEYIRLYRGADSIPVPAATNPRIDEESSFRVVDLPDLRPGDRLDYAYVETSVPTDGTIVGMIDLAEGGDTDRRNVRLLVPPKAGVGVQILGEAPAPERSVVGKDVVYTWRAENLAPIAFVGNAPGWHFQGPWLRYSSVASWADVGRAAAARFDIAGTPDTAVTELARELSADGASALDRTIAAAQYVQQSIETHDESNASATPRPLREVLASKSGTSIEKALLLASLARAMGLDARVGLGSRFYRRRLPEMLPGAEILTAALTGIRIDGHVTWIDPTQRDYPKAGFVTPPIETLLPADAESTGLIDLPTQVSFEPTVDVVETYELDGDSATHTIVTTLRGGDAEQMRGRVALSTAEKIGDEFIDNAKHLDASVQALERPRFDDDTELNQLVITERYHVPDFWRDGTRALHPVEVVGNMVIPDDNRPRVPLQVPHPQHIRHRFIVGPLPREFPASAPMDKTVETDAFVLELTDRMRNRTVEVSWQYRSKASYVAADRLADYQRGLNTPMYSYELWWMVKTPGSPYWYRYLMVLGGFILAGGTLQTLERRRVKRRATARVMKVQP